MYAGVSCGCLKQLAEYKFGIYHHHTLGRRKCGRMVDTEMVRAQVVSFYTEEAVVRGCTRNE
ncbi:hypothetical protein T10_6510 [Trichinella papuae]|uniref:Uncharacterized protein n=1 Tax=Trichinella papuae TaxID=268474 RepID=A0A0V1LYS3_9BILA|nr:hypothetical protein T10_6510 [Trichinella papuae]